MAALSLFLTSVAVAGDDPATPEAQQAENETEQALDRAKSHLLNAMKALGEAGALTYDQHMPELREKTGQAMKEAQSLLDNLEKQVQQEMQELRERQERKKREESKPEPTPEPETLPAI